MATCDSQQDTIDLTSCSICFEKFKSPRILPCSHSFCHRCLCTYIVSSCDQKDFPLGFPCPLCREFVPSPGQPDEVKRWADKFPINDALIQLMEGQDFNVCWACKRENEDEEATDFCLTCKEPLCKMCLKFHRKNLTSMSHEICLVSEIGSRNFGQRNISIRCEKHEKQIVLFCHDHKAPCCTECLTVEHSKCKNMLTVEKAVENVQSLGLMKTLELDIEKMKGELEMAKKFQDENIVTLDNASDKYMEEAQKLQQSILCQVNRLFDEYFTDITTKTKDAKRKMEKSTTSVSDRIDFLEYLLKLLKSSNISADSDDLKLKYISTFHRVKENMAKILEYPFSETTVILTADIPENVKQITEFKRIGAISLTESSISEIVRIRNRNFSLLSKCNLQAVIRGGTVLTNGDLLCTDHLNSKCLLVCMSHKLWGNDAAFNLKCNPWEILLDNETLYISNNQQSGLIEQISADNFVSLSPLYVRNCCSGLAIIRDVLFVVSDYCCILKLSKHGRGIIETIFKTESKGLRYLTRITDDKLVCSNFIEHYVIALDKTGKKIWIYQHTELKGPYGLDKDSQSNIYVAGRKSNNIHILSRQGSLLRILGDIISPVCLKLRKGTCTAFVMCHEQAKATSEVMLYQFK